MIKSVDSKINNLRGNVFSSYYNIARSNLSKGLCRRLNANLSDNLDDKLARKSYAPLYVGLRKSLHAAAEEKVDD